MLNLKLHSKIMYYLIFMIFGAFDINMPSIYFRTVVLQIFLMTRISHSVLKLQLLVVHKGYFLPFTEYHNYIFTSIQLSETSVYNFPTWPGSPCSYHMRTASLARKALLGARLMKIEFALIVHFCPFRGRGREEYGHFLSISSLNTNEILPKSWNNSTQFTNSSILYIIEVQTRPGLSLSLS